MEDHLLTETTRFRQLGAHATVGSYARPTINKHTILGPKAKFTVLYAPGYKHNLTYKHAILGPNCMLIARFYCSTLISLI